MSLAIVAPELVVAWAFGQWMGSCDQLVDILKQYPDHGWTETHAMFAYMGGFCLTSKEDRSVQRVLYKKEFFAQVLDGKVELPKIKEEAIREKGKCDSIAKAIVVIQTLWFGAQAAYRVSQGFDVIQLELTTLGHVVLNILIYFFWWNKPWNLQLPIDVYRKSKRLQASSSKKMRSIGNALGREPESQTPLRPWLTLRVRIATLGNESGGLAKTFRVAGIFLFAVVLCLFGAVHCLAWNSPFPTHAERVLWRSCAPIVTGIPAIGVLAFALGLKSKGRVGEVMITVNILLVLVYTLARICLLMLSLASLRALPFKAYENPSWTLYTPHIS